MAIKLCGSRIKLRPLIKSDAKSILCYANEKEIARYTTLPYPYTLKHAAVFIKLTQKNLNQNSAIELGIDFNAFSNIKAVRAAIYLSTMPFP